jgi:hypothetical protein
MEDLKIRSNYNPTQGVLGHWVTVTWREMAKRGGCREG